MWINPLYDISRRAEALDLVRTHPMAMLVAGGDRVRISHMPLLIEEHGPDRLELIGHIPKADTLAKSIMAGDRITAVFQGPLSYVSPTWYVDPGLPTYNFLVAHVSGTPELLAGDDALRAHLIDLIAAHEAGCPITGTPWQPDAVAHARIDELLQLIIGFRIVIDDFQAKAKLGQNRSIADQESAAGVLRESPRSDDRHIAHMMDLSSAERSTTQEERA